MSYRAVLGLNLGLSKAGQSLRGQLLTSSGTIYGSTIASGFTEIGNGQYLFDYNQYPTNFRGALVVYPSGSIYSSGYLTIGFNPESFEYIDDKISSIPSGINTYLSSIHGSGNWQASSQSINNYQIDIYTKDQTNNPIGGSVVAVYPSGSTSLISYGFTNASTGKFSFNLDNGNYKIEAYKHAVVSFTNPTYITVDNVDAVYNITGTIFTVTPPVGSELVRIYAYLIDLGLSSDYDCADMLVKPSGTSNFGSFLVTDRPIRSSPDSSGYVYADVAPNMDIRVKIPRADFDYYMTTPGSGTFNLATLL